MVLWKKESDSKDTMYVNLMGWHNHNVGQALAQRTAPGKNDTKSTEFRMLGNKQFQERNGKMRWNCIINVCDLPAMVRKTSVWRMEIVRHVFYSWKCITGV